MNSQTQITLNGEMEAGKVLPCSGRVIIKLVDYIPGLNKKEKEKKESYLKKIFFIAIQSAFNHRGIQLRHQHVIVRKTYSLRWDIRQSVRQSNRNRPSFRQNFECYSPEAIKRTYSARIYWMALAFVSLYQLEKKARHLTIHN